MSTYLQRISINAEEKKIKELETVNELAKGQLDVDIMTTKSAVSKAARELEDLRSTVPYNAGNIIEAKRTLAELKADLADLETLKTEDFGA